MPTAEQKKLSEDDWKAGLPRPDATNPEISAGSGHRGSAGDVYYDWSQVKLPQPVKEYRPYFVCSVILVLGCLMVWTFSNGEWKIENIHVNPMLGPSVEALIDSGAKRGDLIIQDGEGWRLVSAYWIHAGVIHLFLAIFGLIAFGWGMEKEWGWMRVAPIYLIGGLFGELLSTMIVPTTVGVGALGAVLALFGAEWGDIAQNHRLYRRSVIKQTVTLVLFMFVCMFVGLLPFIDNWANVGGTAMGILLGTAILVREDPALSQARKRIQNLVRMAAAIGALAMVIAGFAVLYTNVHGEWCGSACEALDCQEFPVGNATGVDKWWYCSDCRLYGFTSYLQADGSGYIVCPDQSLVRFAGHAGADDAKLLSICDAQCLDLGFGSANATTVVNFGASYSDRRLTATMLGE